MNSNTFVQKLEKKNCCFTVNNERFTTFKTLKQKTIKCSLFAVNCSMFSCMVFPLFANIICPQRIMKPKKCPSAFVCRLFHISLISLVSHFTDFSQFLILLKYKISIAALITDRRLERSNGWCCSTPTNSGKYSPIKWQGVL